ncbi:MAG: UvrD-helicase domain-containing protein, partial [Candidatus Colwellbacteria bacterium]|nr:UvrD-helicase domain-containing protein [Candidatus Colwellbacteria bacterium]
MIHRTAPKKQLAAKISLNDEQNKAVNHLHGPLLVTAGAGSGKTRTLTQRVVRLLGEGVPPGRIIAITFTN